MRKADVQGISLPGEKLSFRTSKVLSFRSLQMAWWEGNREEKKVIYINDRRHS